MLILKRSRDFFKLNEDIHTKLVMKDKTIDFVLPALVQLYQNQGVGNKISNPYVQPLRVP